MQLPTRLIDPQDNLALMRAELEHRRSFGVWKEFSWTQSSSRSMGAWAVTETFKLYFRKTIDPAVSNKAALDMVGVTACRSDYSTHLRYSTTYRVVLPIAGMHNASFVVAATFEGDPTFSPDEIYNAAREMLRGELGSIIPGQPQPDIEWKDGDKDHVEVVPNIYELQPGALIRRHSGNDFNFSERKSRDPYADGRSFAHDVHISQADVLSVVAKYPSLSFKSPPYFHYASGVVLADKKTVYRKRLRLVSWRDGARPIPKVGGPIFTHLKDIDELSVLSYPRKLGRRFEPDKWVMARRWFEALAQSRRHHVRLIAPGICTVVLIDVRCSRYWDRFHTMLDSSVQSYSDIVRILPWEKDRHRGL